MTDVRHNVHGTAIVIGTTGFLFVGGSGAGKSSLAHACVTAARSRGLFSALVSDDQVFLSLRSERVLAEAPPTIAGLIELRGVGIVATEHISPALMQFAVMPVDLSKAPRLPDEGDYHEVVPGIALPLLRLPVTAIDPLGLLMAQIPQG